ncbi:hypothetical protein PTSG_10200 [Salpingoeca rosetta]|uniref:Pentacotripeptide-repeat region of PRORP domain-containing protein n=1 Tax=Salpingoeca rosetta (strain ATCC 50818 / BSB-021) TaxID=946362 RepID=F2UQL3_SALR5|nr:uncharacterized protein PTSG_10200 [Salpingoeca rosetta]EGD79918.1 hypothetical protein PTSG_10200 [Salpingoeca rosetta]|eukprot:XP_004988539.1 hypothetical protein PTSG_10200 [Salpingoeca rosetta]
MSGSGSGGNEEDEDGTHHDEQEGQRQRQGRGGGGRQKHQHRHEDVVRKVLNAHNPDPQAALRALRSCTKAVDPESAYAIVEHLRKSGITPSQAHLHAWLACASPRRDGRGILDMMARYGMVIDQDTVLSAAQGAVRHRAWTHFDQYMQWIDAYGIKPDHLFYSRLLTLLAETSNLPPAEFVLQHAAAHGVVMDPVMLSAMLSLNHAYRRFDRVVELYDTYRQGPVKMTVKTFSAAINALTFSTRVRDAERMFADIRRCKLPVQVPHYTALMNVYGECGRLDDVFRLFAEVEGTHRLPDAITFVTMLRACAKAGDRERAAFVWRHMQDKYGIVPDEPAWNAYIRAHADPTNMSHVRGLTLAMRAAGVPMTIFYFNHLMHVFAAAGRPRDVEQLVSKAEALGLRPTVLERMAEAGITRNDVRVYTCMLEALAAAKQWDEILSTCQRMLDAWVLLDARAFVPVLRALVARGQAAAAMNVLTVDMGRHLARYDARHLATVLQGLTRAATATAGDGDGGGGDVAGEGVGDVGGSVVGGTNEGASEGQEEGDGARQQLERVVALAVEWLDTHARAGGDGGDGDGEEEQGRDARAVAGLRRALDAARATLGGPEAK